MRGAGGDLTARSCAIASDSGEHLLAEAGEGLLLLVDVCGPGGGVPDLGGGVLAHHDDVAVEAGVTEAWWRWVGPRGRVVGINRFGASAPAKVLFPHFGITAEAVAQAARDSLAG